MRRTQSLKLSSAYYSKSPPVCGRSWTHLRNSPSGFLIMGNNYLKQLSFGARLRGLAAPLYRPPSAATLGRWIRFAVRAPLSKLFFRLFRLFPISNRQGEKHRCARRSFVKNPPPASRPRPFFRGKVRPCLYAILLGPRRNLTRKMRKITLPAILSGLQ